MKAVAFYYYKPPRFAKPVPATTTIFEYLRRGLFKLNGYNQYGLYHDDILYEWPDIKEALRRLPPDLTDERNYRMVRAIQLDIQRIRLPRDQWTTYEDDLTIGRYLTPYIEEVRKEFNERDAWIAEH